MFYSPDNDPSKLLSQSCKKRRTEAAQKGIRAKDNSAKSRTAQNFPRGADSQRKIDVNRK